MSDLPEIVIEREDPYTRLRAIDWWRQDKLEQARILVAGAGALGNEVLKNLALLGIGHILIVDFDTIEVTNLSRSILFRRGDEQQPKAVLAAQRLREINPDIQVEALYGDVVWDIGLGLLRRFDVVVGCLDNREARLGLNRSCWKVGVPWIDGALGVMAGQVRIFTPSEGACYECTLSDEDYQEINLRYSCQLLVEEGLLSGRVPTTPTGASIIAAMQVQEVLKLLHGQDVLSGHEIEYNGRHHVYRVTKIKRREDCLSHDPIPIDRIVHLPEARASEMTGSELLERVREDLGERAYVFLDREVVTAMVCPNGHGVDRQVRPRHLTGAKAARCPECGAERAVELVHNITDDVLVEHTLEELGVPPGHILLGRFGRNQRYYELGGDLGGQRDL